ncbi:MAG: tyrosyl-tRNA synthetase [Oscillospiraceae bacterium]|jgi:tyrosyl-tRNA synthetase|nr:tyrosyl-tRNA synthetase [Oscillospiraceae bacterium]
MTVFEELKRRGLIAQLTHEDKIKELFENERVTFYIGFDATADSLHVGHFLQLMVMAHMQKAGHRPIVILGTGTTMIGDPTGKTDMRKMLTIEQINHNAECFKKQMSRFIDFDDDRALILRNGDWLLPLNYLEFLRDVGVHFSVNRMLTAECFKARLEKGLSFLEFNYMLMQSYDFLHLYKEYNCKVELGGDDQWSNILGGVELIRKSAGKEAYGMTFTLLTTKEGKKMGKTEKGALWLDAEKTSPYEFFQYWRNVGDEDVINCLKLITFVPIEEIEQMESLEGSELNPVKERLAFEVTKLVHGEEAANQALNTAKNLFGVKSDDADMPATKLEDSDFTDGQIGILTLLVKTKLCPSNGEARRLIQQGGVSIDGDKVTDDKLLIDKEKFEKNIIIKKGKKIYHKVTI